MKETNIIGVKVLSEFDKLLENTERNYDKLMEAILSARDKIVDIFRKDEQSHETASTMAEEYDNVNHPRHYTSHPSGVECVDIIRYYCFTIGSAIKYLWRCGLKKEQGMSDIDKEIEDMKKAIWYIKDRIHQINPHKFFYPKNGHHYTILQDLKMKNSVTGDWEEAVLYTDGKYSYVRNKKDFMLKFQIPS